MDDKLPARVLNRPFARPAAASMSLAVALCAAGFASPALADACTEAAMPTGAAGTSALFGELASSIGAEPIAVSVASRAIGGICAWVYEVRVLTVGGSVAVLDFDLIDLDLRRVFGPDSDPTIAALKADLERDAAIPAAAGDFGSAGPGSPSSGSPSSGSPGSGSPSSGSDDSGGDDSGSSGSGSSGSGSSGSGSSGSGSSGSGSSGSGSSGSGSDDSGSDDSGSDDSGSDDSGGEGGGT
jgi:hypothetical protein